MQNIHIHTSSRHIVFSQNDTQLCATIEQLTLPEPLAENRMTGEIIQISKDDSFKLLEHFHLDYAKEKLNFLQKRAIKKRIDFNLDLEDILRMNAIERCELTGVKLTKSTAYGALRFNASTLDRVDHMKGYVKGNVMVICNSANKLKARYEDPSNSEYAELPPEQLLQVLRDHFQHTWRNNPEYYI